MSGLWLWFAACLLFWGGQVVWAADPGEVLPPGTLTTTELLARFSGQTVDAITAVQGRRSVSYYDPGGEMRQQRLGQTRRGRWRVTTDSRICLQMEELPEKCRIVVKEGEEYRKYIVKKNGRHQHTVTYHGFRRGNPLGL